MIGNGVTIYLLVCTNVRGKDSHRYRLYHTVYESVSIGLILCNSKQTNLFVGSLALCDLLSGFNSPTGAYREVPGNTEFIWPRLFHDVYLFVEYYTSFVANFHIGAFATFRTVQKYLALLEVVGLSELLQIFINLQAESNQP